MITLLDCKIVNDDIAETTDAYVIVKVEEDYSSLEFTYERSIHFTDAELLMPFVGEEITRSTHKYLFNYHRG